MIRLLGLCGRSGAGKDLIAAHLAGVYGLAHIPIADHLKLVTKTAFSMSDDQVWGSARDINDIRWGITPRVAFQRLGDALRLIHPELILRQWRGDVEGALRRGQAVIVPDIRLPAEVDLLRAHGGTLWRIRRAGTRLDPAEREHLTEAACESFCVDADIDNDGSVEELLRQVELLWGQP